MRLPASPYRHHHYWYRGGRSMDAGLEPQWPCIESCQETDRALIGSMHRWTGHAEIQSANRCTWTHEYTP